MAAYRAALSPIGTRLDSIAEVLPDAASACDIVNSRGGACMGSLVRWRVCQLDAYTFLVSFKLVLILRKIPRLGQMNAQCIVGLQKAPLSPRDRVYRFRDIAS